MRPVDFRVAVFLRLVALFTLALARVVAFLPVERARLVTFLAPALARVVAFLPVERARLVTFLAPALARVVAFLPVEPSCPWSRPSSLKPGSYGRSSWPPPPPAWTPSFPWPGPASRPSWSLASRSRPSLRPAPPPDREFPTSVPEVAPATAPAVAPALASARRASRARRPTARYTPPSSDLPRHTWRPPSPAYGACYSGSSTVTSSTRCTGWMAPFSCPQEGRLNHSAMRAWRVAASDNGLKSDRSLPGEPVVSPGRRRGRRARG